MKIFPTAAIRQLDAYTIEHEPITSIELMERASAAVTSAILRHFPEDNTPYAVFAGPGNNGGDALAVARMLISKGCNVQVWLVHCGKSLSPDCTDNLVSLRKIDSVTLNIVEDVFDAPVLPRGCIIVDGLFGSGLNKPLSGVFAQVVRFINNSGCRVVSIDVPSGLMGEDNRCNQYDNVVRASLTLTFQFPKISFLLPENEAFVGCFEILDIALSSEGIRLTDTDFYLTDAGDVRAMLHPRRKFAHKGCFGHALLVAGSQGMAGASLLAARAALRSGVGLLTVNTPRCNNTILQTTVPEAMTLLDDCETHISKAVATERYSSIAIGPGLRSHIDTEHALLDLIEGCHLPMVLDADALNMLAVHSQYLSKLSSQTVLTPHPGEFDRLVGRCDSGYERLEKARALAVDSGICIVLKGAYTAVISPAGHCYFNTTGNPGMATGGSGDVLTGILSALLARGYSAVDAARIGVYVHGLSGDIAAKAVGQTALTAGDIIDYLPAAWMMLE